MDLTTTFMGLELAHPLVPSTSQYTGSLDGLRRLEDAGASAVLLETSLEADEELLELCLLRGSHLDYEASDYLPKPAALQDGFDPFLDMIGKARKSLGIPVIASLTGTEADGWPSYARDIQEAGAHALELNLFFMPTDPDQDGADLVERYIASVRAVREAITLPLAVKFRPSFTAPANVARRLVNEAGADGLVIFNRFYGPDYDLESLDVVPRRVLSDSDELRLPMTWTAVLFGKTRADLGLATGIHTHEDVLKAMMAGASVTQIGSELMQNGLGRLQAILAELSTWLEQREYRSLAQLKGSMAQKHLSTPGELERPGVERELQHPVA